MAEISELLTGLTALLAEIDRLKTELRRQDLDAPGRQRTEQRIVEALDLCCALTTRTMHAHLGAQPPEERDRITTELESARMRFLAQSSEIVLQKLDDLGNIAQRSLERFEDPHHASATKLREQLDDVMKAFKLVFRSPEMGAALNRCVEEITLHIDALDMLEQRPGRRN